jgi:uncharacterized membrane protein
MSFWIGILFVGFIFITIGFLIFFKNPAAFKKKKSALLLGIFLPLFFAYSYGENFLYSSSLQLTLIDLGGLLVLGIISGIFIGCYFLTKRV